MIGLMPNKYYRLGFYRHIDKCIAQPEVNIRKFDTQKYEKMREKTKILWDSRELYLSWNMVVANYNCYLKSTKDRKEELKMHPKLYIASSSSLNDIDSISQAVTNFLATASTFLIVSHRFVKSYFGKTSDKHDTWNEYRKKLHKDSIPYQISYELRNFSQHYAIPLTGNKYSFQSGYLNSIDPYINIKELLSCGYNWRKTSKVLEGLGEIVQLSYLIVEYFDCLKKIMEQTINLILNDLNMSHEYLQYIYKEYDFPKDVVLILFEMDGSTDDFNKLNQEYIPVYLMDYIEKTNKELPALN